MFDAALLAVFPILVVFAGVSDLLTMTIPNRVSVLLVAAFVVLGFMAGLSPADWGYHALGGAVVFVACFAMFGLGWMGGGDAKVASAIALWFGFGPELLSFVIMTAIYGMILTLGLLFFKRIPALPLIMAQTHWISRLHDTRTGIPYGIAIAAAALMIYPQSPWFAALAG